MNTTGFEDVGAVFGQHVSDSVGNSVPELLLSPAGGRSLVTFQPGEVFSMGASSRARDPSITKVARTPW